MSSRRPSSVQPEDGQLKESLAVLISSTHSRIRPLPLTEIAKWLKLAVAKLGSYSAVAERIGLSPQMLRQFSNIERLSGPVQKLFQTKQLDSVDAATHLAMLPAGEQEVVARALASRKIDTNDIRAVIQLRQRGQRGPINSLLKRVSDSKAKQEYVAEFIVRGVISRTSIKRAFKRYIPDKEILGLELNGALGRLVLSKRGNEALARAARAMHVPLKNVISSILHDLG
ncbi:MAG: hypothetical protein WCE23_14025 [Candidatus Binatus sp.]|uniref:hypothetical protein n=1 Tax=Candidatus Binatus sp. TaxID=2811406 RepID=UPI003C788B5C